MQGQLWIVIDDEVLVHISPRPGECQMRRYVCLITEALGLPLFLFACFVLTQADVFLYVRQIASRIVCLCGVGSRDASIRTLH